MRKPLDPRTIGIVAIRSFTCTKSVERRISGRPGRPSIDARIDSALRDLGLAHLIPMDGDKGENPAKEGSSK